jgi:hypothetical protein
MKTATLSPEDKKLIEKYHTLDETSQRLIDNMMDKLLLTQIMTQKNTVPLDGEESKQKNRHG